MQDRNFDDIAEKFSRNIYGTTKGQLRQAIDVYKRQQPQRANFTSLVSSVVWRASG